VPIHDFAEANEELANMSMETYFQCCGKSICGGCIHSFRMSGNDEKCPFCNAMTGGKTNNKINEELMKRVEANDAFSMMVLGNNYYHGDLGLLQDRERAIELWKQAADLGYSKSHSQLGAYYHAGGDSKKEKFHYEAAAMAGDEVARNNLGTMVAQSGNMERAVKHWMISASAGHHYAMDNLLIAFNKGLVRRKTIDSSLIAYNNACAEMRSEARDAFIRSRSN
jgi:TPR repeat protein